MSRVNSICAFFGAAFGFLFCAAGLNQYNIIHRMLLLQYWNPFLIMGSSMIVSMGLLLILERRRWQTPFGGELALGRWPIERKHLYGGLIFGTGWAITGACPGTVSGMIAAGSLLGFVTLAGVLAGIALRDWMADRERALSGETVAEAGASLSVQPAGVDV